MSVARQRRYAYMKANGLIRSERMHLSPMQRKTYAALTTNWKSAYQLESNERTCNVLVKAHLALCRMEGGRMLYALNTRNGKTEGQSGEAAKERSDA